MSSKLFHTIVAVGISLGAASVGCSSPAGDPQVAGNRELTSTDANEPGQAQPADADAGPGVDAFCDATWPTTKGGLHHHPPPACVDPTGACAQLGLPFECAPVTASGACGWDTTMSVCFDGAWTCKTGRMPQTACTCGEGDPACDPTPPATTPVK